VLEKEKGKERKGYCVRERERKGRVTSKCERYLILKGRHEWKQRDMQQRKREKVEKE